MLSKTDRIKYLERNNEVLFKEVEKSRNSINALLKYLKVEEIKKAEPYYWGFTVSEIIKKTK